MLAIYSPSKSRDPCSATCSFLQQREGNQKSWHLLTSYSGLETVAQSTRLDLFTNTSYSQHADFNDYKTVTAPPPPPMSISKFSCGRKIERDIPMKVYNLNQKYSYVPKGQARPQDEGSYHSPATSSLSSPSHSSIPPASSPSRSPERLSSHPSLPILRLQRQTPILQNITLIPSEPLPPHTVSQTRPVQDIRMPIPVRAPSPGVTNFKRTFPVQQSNTVVRPNDTESNNILPSFASLTAQIRVGC